MKILRESEVVAITGMSASSIRRAEQIKAFPSRRKLMPGGRSIGWLDNEVRDWLQSRAAITTGATRDTTRIGNGKAGPGRGHKPTS